MLIFEFTRYIVNKEEDFIEDGVDKISSHLTVCVGVVGAVDNKPPEMTRDLIVVNLNSQTGAQMDAQREAACIAYVASEFNV
jgi:hypothetical protein